MNTKYYKHKMKLKLMRKKITTLTLLCLALNANAQISIQSTDVPSPANQTFNFQTFKHNSAKPNNVSASNNFNIDLSSPIPDSLTNWYYDTETDAFFTSKGATFSTDNFKFQKPNYGFNISKKYAQNSNEIKEIGISLEYQGYSLGPQTGNALDSITFPAQNILGSTAVTSMAFPLTINKSWQSNSRKSVNFIINAPAFGLNNAPCKQVYYDVRKDTVVGWGKMRTYVNGSVSKYYDVLMVKTEQYAIDSFFVGNAPASPQLQAGFGIQQGQRINYDNRISFYHKGSYAPFVQYFYGANNFTSPVSIAYNNKNVWSASINNQKNNYTSLIYPNPNNGLAINVQISNNQILSLNYTILDITGKAIESNICNASNGTFTIDNKNLNNGIYYLKLETTEGQTIANEKIVVNK